MADETICSVDSCGNPILAKKLCSRHYRRVKRYGTVLGSGRERNKRTRDTCLVEGCSISPKAKGYCKRHYQRLTRGSDPHASPKEVAPSGAPLQWLYDHIEHTDDDCLLWPFGSYSSGYGTVRYKGRNRRASRVMCELAHGQPPTEDHHAAHTCGKGHLGCANPLHLEWKTPKANVSDKAIHGTLVYGDRSTSAKLTSAEVRQIRKMIGTLTNAEIASQFGVSAPTISAIKTGRNWNLVR